MALPVTTAPADLGEIEAALDRHGLVARRIEELSPPGPTKRGRSAHRVELADGRTIKARRLESAEAARRLHALGLGLEPAFSRGIGHAGRVLLEEWIAGEPLAEPEAWVEAAGALLGRLHATPIAASPREVDTRRWRDEAARDLAHLEEAGLLGAAERERLGTIASEADPGRALLVLAHRDFCAENMIVDGAGALRVIDNEWLSPQPAGIDLARTALRWPMSPPAWQRFLVSYRAHAPADPGPLSFWEVSAVAWTARVRLRSRPEHAARALARLREVASPRRAPP